MGHARYERFREIVSEERIRGTAVTVIGVGAIGRQVALQLAAMGIGEMQLVDFDVVEEVNLGPQGYALRDVGKLKVEATKEACLQLNPDTRIVTVADRFVRSMPVHPLVLLCVDSIGDRRFIYEAVKRKIRLLIDARMSAEVIRVLCAERDRPHSYDRTLFSQTEAFAGACTARSTLYSACIAAGLMVHQLTRFLREIPTEPDMLFNLLAGEVSFGDVSSTGK